MITPERLRIRIEVAHYAFRVTLNDESLTNSSDPEHCVRRAEEEAAAVLCDDAAYEKWRELRRTNRDELRGCMSTVTLTVTIPTELAEWFQSVTARKDYSADEIVTSALANELPIIESLSGVSGDHGDPWREHLEWVGPPAGPSRMLRLWELMEAGNEYILV
jgi:hypothetical protein